MRVLLSTLFFLLAIDNIYASQTVTVEEDASTVTYKTQVRYTIKEHNQNIEQLNSIRSEKNKEYIDSLIQHYTVYNRALEDLLLKIDKLAVPDIESKISSIHREHNLFSNAAGGYY